MCQPGEGGERKNDLDQRGCQEAVWYESTVGTVSRVPHLPTTSGPTLIDPGNPNIFHLPADPEDPTDSDAWASILELPDAPPAMWTSTRRARRGASPLCYPAAPGAPTRRHPRQKRPPIPEKVPDET
ncbi:hypothetical protein GCM10010109_21490 [Actinoplanes campanulatus]|nr:hypothetical protein GCM10010109_21490 [Actinoplanes campanulatus]GID36665.1 hypothetical protein Aca09nite_31710 [Actinoplanes campanulatus]